MKFTFDGRIDVSLRATDGSVVLRVADSGVGIPAAELPRVFERFHRIEGTRARTHDGSGIGLALVQELARLHGGSVSVESELRRGTTFTVIVPKGMAHLPQEQVQGGRAQPSRASGASPFVDEALGWFSDGGAARSLEIAGGDGASDRDHVTLRDRSAEKVVERERAARLAEAERALQFSEMFAAILGHDLRNPLSAITTAASLLQMRADSEKLAMPVRRIVAGADRMERMISQLLDFTRIRLGRGLPLELARCDLGVVARSIIDELEPVRKRQFTLEVSGDATGVWDGDRLSQLLSNLAANACQHGSPELPVLIRIDGTPGDVVYVEVRNGGAIPPELLPVLFEPMGRVAQRQDRRDGSSGLGLGLYITQQIALAHGGSIAVESGPLTRFVLTLPRQDSPESTRSAGVSLFTRAQEESPS